MVLFYSVAYWNDWFAAFLYLDKQELFPVTLFLRNLIAGASTTASEGAAAAGTTTAAINANIQSVTMILTIIPILCVYPFVQRYFVSGVMLGSVKG
jgi:putative aldouronate transport system permease protein